MPKALRIVNYQYLTQKLLAEKFSLLVLGITTLLAIVLIVLKAADPYIYTYRLNSAVDNKAAAEALQVTVQPAVRGQQTAPAGQIGEGLMTGRVTFKGKVYTVQAGDSLSLIAYKVYGDYEAWVRIAQANNITNPEVIEEGTQLKLP